MSGRLKRKMWKMQHVEVQLYENEKYEDENPYTNRRTVVKEITYEMENGYSVYCQI